MSFLKAKFHSISPVGFTGETGDPNRNTCPVCQADEATLYPAESAFM